MGAKVTLTNVATSATRTAQTGSMGQYGIPALTPGNYNVTIGCQDFATFNTNVEVAVGTVATVDAALKIVTSLTVVKATAWTATQVNA